MHLRGNKPSLTDALHIIWAMVTILPHDVHHGISGAARIGKGISLYTIATFCCLHHV